MNTAKKLMMVLRGSGAAAITYLFRDEFTTDRAAGAVNGTDAEPGPGTRATTELTSATWSISDGALVGSPPVPSAYNKLVFLGDSAARAAGRAVQLQTANNLQEINLGILTSAGAVAHSIQAGATTIDIKEHGYLTVPFTGKTAGATANYTFAIRLTAGAMYFGKLAAGNWQLLWVSGQNTTNPICPGVNVYNNAFSMTSMIMRDLPAPFSVDNGIATLNTASAADATEYVGDANGIIDMTVTAPGSLDGSATTRCGFYYRTDADLTPSWHCYVDGLGAFNVDSIAADGTRTNRIAVAAVITGGGTRTLRVIAIGSKHNAYSLSGTTWTKRGAEINVSLNDAVTRIIPSVPAGWSAANLLSYPHTSSAYDELDRS